ncbi:MAG TPA: hypothetical protein VH186_34520 [Chloroflexia bacterium]|nr:hypothetical protein [Chloroflexia bacterium]
MNRLFLVRLRLFGVTLALLLAFFAFDLTALAQSAQPQPTPTRAPSGSNPVKLAPTDVPIEWSLFWVFMFFAVLCVGLLFANWLVRRGTFDEPERRL